jgi:hypothetical protein
MGATRLEGWESAFSRMEAEWGGLGGPPPLSIAEWEAALSRMVLEMRDIEQQGHWSSGPSDLLSVARRSGDELVHSNILASLLTPTARHGMRTALLADVLQATWQIDLDPRWSVRVRREVGRKDATRNRIADVVVEAGTLRLVIENKVFAKEDKLQCEDLYWLWAAPRDDEVRTPELVRLVFLTRHGRPPASVETDDAAAAWMPLDHAWIADWLLRHVEDVRSPVARSSVIQYLICPSPSLPEDHVMTAADDNDGMDEVLEAALEEESGSGLNNERLQFFFRHQPMIQTWQALATEAWTEVAAAMRSLYEDLAGGTSVPDGFSLLRSLPDRDAHGPVLYREDWCVTDPAVPDLVWVLWWDKAPDPSGSWGSRPYSGLLPTGTETGRRLRPLLKPMVRERLRGKDPVDAGFELGIGSASSGTRRRPSAGTSRSRSGDRACSTSSSPVPFRGRSSARRACSGFGLAKAADLAWTRLSTARQNRRPGPPPAIHQRSCGAFNGVSGRGPAAREPVSPALGRDGVEGPPGVGIRHGRLPRRGHPRRGRGTVPPRARDRAGVGHGRRARGPSWATARSCRRLPGSGLRIGEEVVGQVGSRVRRAVPGLALAAIGTEGELTPAGGLGQGEELRARRRRVTVRVRPPRRVPVAAGQEAASLE